MKLMKRSGIYQASNWNVTFNPATKEAYSYKWWKFVAIVEGKLVFNDYRYSNSTSKHQSKVLGLLNDLGIKIDLSLPIPKGIESRSLSELILIGEETVCDKYLENEIKKQDRYQKQKRKKLELKLTDYLENQVHFRDYTIEPANRFGSVHTVAVHQVVESDSIERDVETAIYNFQRDGFGSVVFYV